MLLLKKYGRENFEYFVFQIAETFGEADRLEIFWIAEMRKSLGRKNVYNIADGGRPNRTISGEAHYQYGKSLSPEVRAKISKSLKGKTLGKKLTPAQCKNIANGKMGAKNPNFGKHPSEETLAKMRIRSGGENNPKAKLTANDVLEIRKLLMVGQKSITEITKQFNISHYTINDIKKERTWKNVQ
jgi:group I intron endonuclease